MKPRLSLIVSSILTALYLGALAPGISVHAQDTPSKNEAKAKSQESNAQQEDKSKQALEDLDEANRYLKANDTAKAVQSLKAAVKKLPDNAGLRQRLAKLYYREAELEKAIDEMEVAVRLEPTEGVYQAEMAWLYSKANRFSGAMRHAKIASEIIPDSASPYVILGYCYASSGKNDLAVESLNKALKLEPANLTACLYLAEIYLDEGKAKESIEMFERAKSIDQNNLSILLGLASAYGVLNEKEKAQEYYKSALKLYPDDAETLGRYGWFLSQNGDMPGAFKYGMKANEKRVYQSWDQFMGMFISVWAGIFMVFGLIFAAIAIGAKFKPQSGEEVLHSFFLIMHKEKPGRLVFTSRRIVFVPELISRSFGATRVSIERDQISKIDLTKTDTSGALNVATVSDTEHYFKIPVMIYEPLDKLLREEGLTSGNVGESEGDDAAKKNDSQAKELESSNTDEASEEEEEKVVATRLDFRPEDEKGEDSEESEEAK